jgi:hypothetical protein
MILHCNYEELRALTAAGETLVARGGGAALSRIEPLLPRLTGSVSIDTLDDQRGVREGVALIVDDLRGRMDRQIIEHGPADEDAVTLYFEYGHTLMVLNRLDEMGGEMSAIAELLTGGHPELAGTITFPD